MSINNTKSEANYGWSNIVSKISHKREDTKQKSDSTLTDNNIDLIIANKDHKSSWLNMICCRVSRKIKTFKRENKTHRQNPSHTTEKPTAITTPNDNGTLSPSQFDDQQKSEIPNCGISQSDFAPLHQILRYSMDSSDLRKFQLHRMIQPYKPTYEIEWQKNEWLQLDNSTSRKIEHLRKRGFSKIPIRQDQTLKKHIIYDNPSEADILLELSIYATKNENGTTTGFKPILCHQPSQFSLRRTYWWHASYRVGEAHLPNWADKNSCCNKSMDTTPGINIVCNYNQPQISTTQQFNIFPDTPSVSENSSVSQPVESLSLGSVKPLKYTEPPFLMPEPVLCAA